MKNNKKEEKIDPLFWAWNSISKPELEKEKMPLSPAFQSPTSPLEPHKISSPLPDDQKSKFLKKEDNTKTNSTTNKKESTPSTTTPVFTTPPTQTIPTIDKKRKASPQIEPEINKIPKIEKKS